MPALEGLVGLDVTEQLVLLAKVAFAMLLGAIVGLEREAADKPAGLRTHMLVAGAAATLVGLANVVVGRFDAQTSSGMVQSDPIRVIEAVVTGISFLGAGTIIQRGRSRRVEGLTTAASILFAAAVGMAVALNQVVLALGATGLVLLTLRGMHAVENRLLPPHGERGDGDGRR
jgi:putative Mg2+ transporter-C (MgtC) family protein